ncbi:hypothetical protein ACS5UA_19280 [Brucella sp. RRSP16]|uniref:hypothetical protein n=1 Tax=Brucella TaxID=234 RepID=UPI000C2917DF|nr:hypothetical protein CN882_09945 [Ochrobactrum sp. 23A/997/2015]
MHAQTIWDLERGFWLEGVSFYVQHLHQQALMVLPSVGTLSRKSILESLKDVPRWENVLMHDMTLAEDSHCIAITYVAEARRAGEPLYHANCSSAYVGSSDFWQLILHHQTQSL